MLSSVMSIMMMPFLPEVVRMDSLSDLEGEEPREVGEEMEMRSRGGGDEGSQAS